MESTNIFSEEDVYLELQRVLNFPLFKNSPVLYKFLHYIVTETINKRDHYLKEYTIAVNVLSRNASFNSQDDAVVRIHAGRLRRSLNEYYLSEGLDNTIHITVPKGAYVPEFRNSKKVIENSTIPALPKSQSTNPVVAIFPFRASPKDTDIDLFALQLKDELTGELSRFQDISVIGHHSLKMISIINDNILEAAHLLAADYIITGSVQYSERKVRIRINLLIALTGEIVMTKSLEREVISEVFETQDEIIKTVIGAIGGYYGYIFQQMPKAAPDKVSSNIRIWEGMYNYYQYQRSYSIENHKVAIVSLRLAVKHDPSHAVSWAMLGELYLNGVGLDLKNIESPMEEGYFCCMEALKIDPLCQQAWHTYTLLNLFKKEKEDCLDAAHQCVKLNPNCSVIIAGVGIMLICAGFFDEGFNIMDRAIKLNSYYPWWINCGFSFYYLHKKDYAASNHWANKIKAEETFWDPLLKSATLSYMNEDAEAKKELSKLLKIEPETPIKIETMLSTLIIPDELVNQIIMGLHKAGMQN